MSKVVVVSSVFIVLVIIAGIIGYEIVLPETTGRQYITRLHGSAQTLRTDFENISGGTDTPLLNNPGAPIEERKTGTRQLKNTLADTKKHLEKLEETSKSLQPVPYSGYTSTYTQAVALQERSKRVITQAENVLDDFEKTVVFLELHAGTIDTTQTAIDTFNQTTELSSLAGETTTLRQTATQIITDTEKLEKIETPAGFSDVIAASVRTLKQTAEGFNELADGLDIGADSQIDLAARKIESAGLQIDSTDTSNYVAAVQRSRSIQSVHELNEKLDLILP